MKRPVLIPFQWILLAFLNSVTALGQTAAPVLEKIEPLHRAVRLTWSTPAEQVYSGFRICRSTEPDSGFQTVQWVPGADRRKFDYWLENGTTYYYRLTGTVAGGVETAFSNTVHAAPAEAGPDPSSMTPKAANADETGILCTVYGIHFAPGDGVVLIHGETKETVAGVEIDVIQPDQIACRFDLRNRSTGPYDLSVTRPGAAAQLKNAFTIVYGSIRFTETASSAGLTPNRFLSFGSAWGDYDNDGWLDLFVANEEAENQLFHNDRGSFTPFDGAGSVGSGGASGVAWVDFDNDGDLDLYMSSLKDPHCLLKNRFVPEGLAGFEPAGLESGLQDTSSARPQITGAAWADYDGDGKLDLYLTDNGDGLPNRLYRNRGGIFTRVSADSIGLDTADEDSYCPVWADYDNDGDQDLYVGNGGVNRLFRKGSGGLFMDVSVKAGTAYPWHTENAAWGDYDQDGLLDLFLANTNKLPNILYHNCGGGLFEEAGNQMAFRDSVDSFAAAWGDYDNDGDLDLFVAGGGFREDTLSNEGGELNRLFENREGVFVDAAGPAGIAETLVATAAVWGDYDNDGFLDLFVAVRDTRSKKTGSGFSSANRLYRNMGGNGNKYVKVLLEGSVSNRSGVGARIELWSRNRRQIREINGGDGRSHGGVVAHFGLGRAGGIDSIGVKWPSGIEQVRRAHLRENDTLWIREPGRLFRPGRVQARLEFNKISISWSDDREGTDAVGFNLYRGTTHHFSPDSVLLLAANIGNAFYTDADVADGTEYTYWVRASDAGRNLSPVSKPAVIVMKRESYRVGDFTSPRDTIDLKDFTAFAERYGKPLPGGALTAAETAYDIGPASGEPPELTPLPDGKIDFEDLVVFMQMWRYAMRSRPSKPGGLQPAADENDDVRVEALEPDEGAAGGTVLIRLAPKRAFPLKAGQFEIRFDPSVFEAVKAEPGEAFFTGDTRPFSLEYEEKEAGTFVVIACRRNRSDFGKEMSPQAFQNDLLRVCLKRKNPSGSCLSISYELHGTVDGIKLKGNLASSFGAVPEKMVLYPNYPNPFNASTSLRYGIPNSGKVRLSVLNALGQNVRVLVDEEKPAGFHSVKWDGLSTGSRKISSGVYFFKLETGKGIQVRKSLFLQ